MKDASISILRYLSKRHDEGIGACIYFNGWSVEPRDTLHPQVEKAHVSSLIRHGYIDDRRGILYITEKGLKKIRDPKTVERFPFIDAAMEKLQRILEQD